MPALAHNAYVASDPVIAPDKKAAMTLASPVKTLVLDFNGTQKSPSAEILRTDLSAIVWHGEYLWLASDETASIERLKIQGDDVYGDRQSFSIAAFLPLPGRQDEEVDIEGMCLADGYLWVAGSHSLTRRKPKPHHTGRQALSRLERLRFSPNRCLVGRVPLTVDQDGAPVPCGRTADHYAAWIDMDGEGSELYRELQNDDHIGRFVHVPGKENGLDVEGLAVAGDRILLGLRGPVLRGWAIILELEIAGTDDHGTLELARRRKSRICYRKRFLDLGGLGIRDLVIRGKDLVILAGPTMDLDGPVSVFLWPNGIESDRVVMPRRRLAKILDLPYGDGCDHPEGLSVFGDDPAGRDLVVVYDSPGPDRLLSPGHVTADVVRTAR